MAGGASTYRKKKRPRVFATRGPLDSRRNLTLAPGLCEAGARPEKASREISYSTLR
jgi:hypothetical protein